MLVNHTKKLTPTQILQQALDKAQACQLELEGVRYVLSSQLICTYWADFAHTSATILESRRKLEESPICEEEANDRVSELEGCIASHQTTGSKAFLKRFHNDWATKHALIQFLKNCWSFQPHGRR
jgi:hypothetical protein